MLNFQIDLFISNKQQKLKERERRRILPLEKAVETYLNTTHSNYEE